MSNPKPTCKFERKSEVELAPQMTGVRLPLDIDEYVRSLPNKTEWLRKAIADAYKRDIAQQQNQQVAG